MMKKGGLLFLVAAGLAALAPILASSEGTGAGGDLAAAYKKGRIVLEPDPDFAKDADWEALFPYNQLRVAVAPDGSIFVSNSRDHNVCKFSPEGKLVKKFGKRGQGPGDLEFPGDLSILDGSGLVVGDYMSNRRISVFELDGTFRAVYKTAGPASMPVALGDGKIAYIGLTGTIEPRGDGFVDVNVNRVMVFDTATGRSREVESIKTSMNAPKDGEVKIASSAGGDLLVGHTVQPELQVFGPDGSRKGVIKLAIDALPVTQKAAEAHQVKASYGGKKVVMPMGDFLPYYCDFTVDAEGNILVFKTSEDPKTGPIVFQVYAPDGRFLCETELDRGAFDLPMDRFMRPRLAFTSRGVYGVLPLRGDELETPRLFRVRLRT